MAKIKDYIESINRTGSGKRVFYADSLIGSTLDILGGIKVNGVVLVDTDNSVQRPLIKPEVIDYTGQTSSLTYDGWDKNQNPPLNKTFSSLELKNSPFSPLVVKLTGKKAGTSTYAYDTDSVIKAKTIGEFGNDISVVFSIVGPSIIQGTDITIYVNPNNINF